MSLVYVRIYYVAHASFKRVTSYAEERNPPSLELSKCPNMFKNCMKEWITHIKSEKALEKGSFGDSRGLLRSVDQKLWASFPKNFYELTWRLFLEHFFWTSIYIPRNGVKILLRDVAKQTSFRVEISVKVKHYFTLFLKHLLSPYFGKKENLTLLPLF